MVGSRGNGGQGGGDLGVVRVKGWWGRGGGGGQRDGGGIGWGLGVVGSRGSGFRGGRV